ncbi:hypothetical protein [Pseudomonas juntendi]|uniref:hypothetical protein n=1 Tax=Pseudomonas juntendi TaxID=2666183 RepID=UPI003455B36A
MLANTISTIQTTIIDSNILEKLIIFIDSYTEIFDGIFGSVFGLVPLLLMSLTFIQAEALKQKIIEIKNRGV